MRPESGRMENWYVIAIPKIDLLPSSRLGPRVRIFARPFGGDETVLQVSVLLTRRFRRFAARCPPDR
jgi:hypothetical protein